MIILGIETSCDETGAAVIEDGTKILSNVVSSSTELFQKYGGIVPEIAAREQLKIILPVIDSALDKAGVAMPRIDALAVTYGPGLIGSLLVGVETVKTLAWIFKKPLVPVNHLIGHVYANWLDQKTPLFPQICLIVSGGHTDLIFATNHGKYKWLGGTKDDAAGEVFDKVARLLGLGYPGGPQIEKISKNSNQNVYQLPRPLINSNDFNFSFSGLKTAVVNLWKKTEHNKKSKADMAASFQSAITEVLVSKTIKAAKQYKVSEILIGGGVAANLFLRSQLLKQATQESFDVRFPKKGLAIDNAAMVAAAAYFNFKPEKIDKVRAEPGLYF